MQASTLLRKPIYASCKIACPEDFLSYRVNVKNKTVKTVQREALNGFFRVLTVNLFLTVEIILSIMYSIFRNYKRRTFYGQVL